MKRYLIMTVSGATVITSGCSTVQNLRPAITRTASCEAVTLSRAEYEAYLALGADKPYYCAINVPPAPRVTTVQEGATQ